jgi:hypothetical protein
MTKGIRCFSNVTLLPLPPYSPELNPVEQLWQQIKQRFLSLKQLLMLNLIVMANMVSESWDYTQFKKQLNQKTPLPTTQIFNKTILT